MRYDVTDEVDTVATSIGNNAIRPNLSLAI